MIMIYDNDDDDDETTAITMASRRRPALQQVSIRRGEWTVLVHIVNSKFLFAVRLSGDSTSLCYQ
jgi:hypothetical protein